MSFKDPEKQREYMRAWQAAHREEHAERCRQWKIDNRDHYNEYNRDYYASHRDDDEWRYNRQSSTRKWRKKKKLEKVLQTC